MLPYVSLQKRTAFGFQIRLKLLAFLITDFGFQIRLKLLAFLISQI